MFGNRYGTSVNYKILRMLRQKGVKKGETE